MEAQYTMLFDTWLTTQDDSSSPRKSFGNRLLDYFRTGWENQSMATQLLNILTSVYRYYECGTSDNLEMLQFMKDTFDEYKKYYLEIISNYEKEYDYALNNKRVTTKKDELTIEGNTNISNEEDRSNTDYELPNKVIPANDYRNTPSAITDNKASTEQNKSYDNNTTRDSSTTVEFNNEFIDLKNKFMRQIRNVYHEFAMKFKECFYQVY